MSRAGRRFTPATRASDIREAGCTRRRRCVPRGCDRATAIPLPRASAGSRRCVLDPAEDGFGELALVALIVDRRVAGDSTWSGCRCAERRPRVIVWPRHQGRLARRLADLHLRRRGRSRRCLVALSWRTVIGSASFTTWSSRIASAVHRSAWPFGLFDSGSRRPRPYRFSQQRVHGVAHLRRVATSRSAGTRVEVRRRRERLVGAYLAAEIDGPSGCGGGADDLTVDRGRHVRPDGSILTGRPSASTVTLAVSTLKPTGLCVKCGPTTLRARRRRRRTSQQRRHSRSHVAIAQEHSHRTSARRRVRLRPVEEPDRNSGLWSRCSQNCRWLRTE